MRNRAGGILIKEGRLLLIHRIKEIDSVKNEYYVVPGGGIEDGETIEDATIREMMEEVGINVQLLSNTPIYELKTDNGIQYFMLVKQIGGALGTGMGLEFKEELYKNNGEYIVSLVDIKDIMNGKIKMVPEEVKNNFIRDISKLDNIVNISSEDLLDFIKNEE